MIATEFITPFWFKQRQLQAEPIDEHRYRVTGPNFPECEVGIRKLENHKYEAFVRRADDPDSEVKAVWEFDNDWEAWEGAFELLRQEYVV